MKIRKTHCKHGHPLSGGNLIACLLMAGRRQCKRCALDSANRSEMRKRRAAGIVATVDKTHCRKGLHEFTSENTVVDERGNRRCKACMYAAAREWKRRHRRAAGILPLGTKKTSCVHGHPLEGRNLSKARKNGTRYCLECKRIQATLESRALGRKPMVHRSPEEKRRLKLKHQLKRVAIKKGVFVEHVDPVIIYQRDEGLCGICRLPVSLNGMHIDHIIPLAKGGEHSYKNTQISHPVCNMKKHARLPHAIELVGPKPKP